MILGMTEGLFAALFIITALAIVGLVLGAIAIDRSHAEPVITIPDVDSTYRG